MVTNIYISKYCSNITKYLTTYEVDSQCTAAVEKALSKQLLGKHRENMHFPTAATNTSSVKAEVPDCFSTKER